MSGSTRVFPMRIEVLPAGRSRHLPARLSLLVLAILAIASFSAPLVAALLDVDPAAVDLFGRHAAPARC